MNIYKTSENGKNLIKGFEQKYAIQYICPSGHPTIGYGHVILSGERFHQPMTDKEIEDLFTRDLLKFETAVRKWFVSVKLNQNQFDAIVCFLFNNGADSLNPSTHTWTALCVEKNYKKFADDLLEWNKDINPKTGKLEVSAGLTIRRNAERSLFLKPM
jgi:lysozyme